MDLLRLVDRIQIAREIGESHFREFKSGNEGRSNKKKPRDVKEICSDIAKTLVAFANVDNYSPTFETEFNSKFEVAKMQKENDIKENLADEGY